MKSLVEYIAQSIASSLTRYRWPRNGKASESTYVSRSRRRQGQSYRAGRSSGPSIRSLLRVAAVKQGRTHRPRDRVAPSER